MGLVYRKELDRHTSFAIWKIEETAVDLYNQLQLKAHEIDYLETLNTGKRHLHWLSTRVLLRKMLNTTEYIDCRIDEYGKPYLANFPHQISLSHSFDYAAVMVSENKKVGIDIELIKTKIERIAHKFLSKPELDFIEKNHRTNHLYVCWCAKEAMYKLQGKKNVSFLSHIKLKPFNYTQEGTFKAELAVNTLKKEYTIHYQKFGEYMLGYVAECDDCSHKQDIFEDQIRIEK